MKIKKLTFVRGVLVGLVAIVLTACPSPWEKSSNEKSVKVSYDGEFIVSMLNENAEGSYGYLYGGEGSKIWTEDELYKILNKLNDLKVEGVKLLGDAYPDYGNLIIKIRKGDDVVATETAPKGSERVTAEYEFKK